jgi:D-alanine-D-alanine ligase
MNIHIGVFFGGRSVEHEISVISAIQAIHAIDRVKYTIIPVYISKDGEWFTGNELIEIANYKDIPALLKKCTKIILSSSSNDFSLVKVKKSLFEKSVISKIDIAFPIMHGTYGEDGCIQGLFELMNIPYVGCNVLASAIGMDKIIMKMVLRESGLPVVDYDWFYFKEWFRNKEFWTEKITKKLGFPVIVKPGNLGSSVGISKAATIVELEEAIDYAGSFSSRILVEKMIENLQEINCSVLGDYEQSEASACEEPIRSGAILSYTDKYITDGSKKGGGSKGMTSTKRRLPADISDEMTRKIQQLARETFRTLGCAGVSRIDFLVDKKDNSIYVNEINTIPGSLSFYLWEATNKKFSVLLNNLIDNALKLHREKNNLIISYQSNIFNLKTDSLKLNK